MKSVVWAIALIIFLTPASLPAEVEGARLPVRFNMVSIATLTENHHEAIKQLWVNPYVAESSSGASIATMVTPKPEQSLIDMVDVIELPLYDAIAACDAGELNMLPVSMLGNDVRLQSGSYVANSVQPCSVGHSLSTTMIVYDASRFQDAPSVLGDFFNVGAFPGKRVLVRQPQAISEWALLVAGVPRNEIYQALSTDWAWSKIELVLEGISEDIIWVDSYDEALDLLSSGSALFGAVSSVDLVRRVAHADSSAAAYNSFNANYDVVWDGTGRYDSAHAYVGGAKDGQRRKRNGFYSICDRPCGKYPCLYFIWTYADFA